MIDVLTPIAKRLPDPKQSGKRRHQKRFGSRNEFAKEDA